MFHITLVGARVQLNDVFYITKRPVEVCCSLCDAFGYQKLRTLRMAAFLLHPFLNTLWHMTGHCFLFSVPALILNV